MEGLSRREIPENRISRQSKSAHTKRRVRSAVGFCLMMGKARRKEKSLSNKKIKYYIIGWENIQNIKMKLALKI